uniref:Clathrin light chain n=1 Tax=Eucampia antarctica TaxID=49252 RepID=A0A7S2SGW8_9STRA|eukprot:CAMPEP_0197827746 /NCGR_PEP_ID=MMETSP1437-20131217/4473_1 /TAXON_ID=49252 ORGANISM="Eucampia antarctica, Strain CCMP1452" /NCGR_SAMPLE_ID=MMETSP1437 /ASSEMBLY_ACC=CAM_ASM_001096 /LENGTH=166 /DNA_ID=CAMNT_0043428727 /DNA_START=30 /DNA_END=530 /DNA_ORIENTATION=+
MINKFSCLALLSFLHPLISSSFVIHSCRFGGNSQLRLSDRPASEFDNPRDPLDTSPPSSFDPNQFDVFEGGGWSTDINNPYVSARYVNVKRASTTSSDEAADPRERALASDKASEERMGTWVRARAEEKKTGQSNEMESFFREKTELDNEQRIAAWKQSNVAPNEE